jgi:hypothetical protein
MGSKAPKIKPLKETKVGLQWILLFPYHQCHNLINFDVSCIKKTKAPKGSWVKKVKKTKGPKDAKKKAKKSPPTLEPTAASTI